MSTPNRYLPPTLSELGHVHFIGMGGAGMSAVARIMLSQGLVVSGSDAKASQTLSELGALGATIFVSQAAENIIGANTVVISSAIRENNPELLAAREAGLLILHRSQALAAAMGKDAVVAVAGTHGKTTTTSMITVMLKGAGVDASFAVGGTVVGLGVNAGHGTADVFVAEADESDASFLNYSPEIEVVTNLEADHLDHYGTPEAVFAAFEDFVALLPADGLLVVCADDAGSASLGHRARNAGVPTISYGFSPEAQLRIIPLTKSGLHTQVTVSVPASPLTGAPAREMELSLAVPGNHNVLNAAAALSVAWGLGVDLESAVDALSRFVGAARRFELKGEEHGVRVFDDYAHHPTEVTAALTAARTVAGDHHVHVLFQPHLFSRTREFAQEFATALQLADSAEVIDIYPAREDPIPGVTSALITDLASGEVSYAAAIPQAIKDLAGRAAPGDIILTVGAGDVTQLGAQLLAALHNADQPRSTELGEGTRA